MSNGEQGNVSIVKIVLEEVRALREENQAQHDRIFAAMDDREKNRNTLCGNREMRIRRLEYWRSYLLGAWVIVVAVFSWLLRKN